MLAAVWVALLSAPCPAQEAAPKPAPLLIKLLSDETVTPDERRRLALFHGMWDRVCDPTPSEQAWMALQRGDLLHAALQDDSTPPLVRAEAALLRGDAEQAIELIGDDRSAVGAVIRAEALDLLGRRLEALEVLTPWRDLLQDRTLDDPVQLTAATRALVLLARHEGRPAHEYHTAMGLFAKIREQIDRLHWPAHLAEAELLQAKDNSADAATAARAALELNPACGRAWYLLGRMALDSFDFQKAEACEKSLRAIHGGHLLAAMLHAEMRLTQRDPEAALSAIQNVLEALPRQRKFIALLAAAEAMRYDDVACAAALERLDALSPAGALGYHETGRFLAATRQYGPAGRMLREAVRRRPNWAEPRVALGLMLMQSGDEDQALETLRSAVALDPFHQRATNSLKLAEHLRDYERLETEHFTIKYREGIDEVMAHDVAARVEQIFDDVTARYRHEPRRKTLIEIMPDEQWFAVRITGMPWIWTIGACTGNVIALTPPRHGPRQRGRFDWFDVVRHEFVHTVTLDQTDNRVPHWFTEGCAVASQTSRRDYDACQLLASALDADRLFPLDLINWAFVRPTSPHERPLAYAQSDWMLQFVTHRFGHDAVVQMLGAYRRGLSDAEALQEATGMGVEPFMSVFKSWATNEVKSWGLAPPEMDAQLQEALTDDGGVDGQRLAELIEKHPNHAGLLKAYALIAADAHAPQARQAVLRYAAARPVDPWSSRMLATLALREGRPQDAIGPLQRLDELELKNSGWSLQLAKLHRSARRHDAAAHAMGGTLRREPYNAAFRELAAAIDLQRGRPEEALHHVRALTLIEPMRSIHHVRLAAVYKRLGRMDDMNAAAQRARELEENGSNE
jgi:tetratricopeptide (TPR) repeat protein